MIGAYATKLKMIGHTLPSANDRVICCQAESDRAYATKLQMIGAYATKL